MIQVVNEYSNYIQDLPQIIGNSHYKSEFLAEKLELKLPTFYRKLRENTFTVEEIKTLTELLYPKEAMFLKIKEDLRQADEDFRAGKFRSSDDVIRDLERKYL